MARRLLAWLSALFLALSSATASAATDPALALFFGYSKAVQAVALSPNGRQAASGGQDNFVRLWDLKTGLLLRTLDGEAGKVASVAFSPDGQLIVAACSDGKLRVFSLTTGQTVATLEGHTGEALSVSVSADGKKALSAGSDRAVKLWDLETGQLVKTLEGHAGEATAVAFAPDGRHALSASADATLRLWDLETGESKTFQGHADAVTSLALCADGAQAVSGSKDKTVRLWDIATGQVLKTFDGFAGEVLSVAFAGDCSRILSGAGDNALKLWDAKTGALLKTLEGHSGAVASARFSSGGREAISGSADKTIRIWDVEAGQATRTIDLQAETFWPNGYRSFFRGAAAAKTADPAEVDKRLQEKGFKRGDPVFLRIFKADLQAELWIKKAGRFELFATYPICAWSGQLGPKLIEGDGQAPEGYYTIGKGQINPNSHYHRAFNLGYPNLFDRAHNRTGALLMVHGGCASIGCYAMTDAAIDELWQIVTAALDAGQERIGVHAFPFRMTEERLAAYDWHPYAEFWRDLKSAHDLFEESRIPPQISVCDKRYAVQPGRAADNAPALRSACPASRTSRPAGRASGDAKPSTWSPEIKREKPKPFPG
jgi:murein L,D-transpeptidase YafK/predicted NACHT family NTPase